MHGGPDPTKEATLFLQLVNYSETLTTSAPNLIQINAI